MSDVGQRRDRSQLRVDRAAAGVQVTALRVTRTTRAFQERMAELLRSRRERDQRAEQFDLVRETGSNHGIAVVRGVLLVRSSLRREAPELFERLVAEVGPAVDRLEGRVLVLSGRGRSAEDLVAWSRRVRRQGFEASVSHIVPLNIVCKGGGCGPTRTTLDAPPALPEPDAAGVRLAVIDTGVAVAGQEHEWQTTLHTGDNVDPLDVFGGAPGPDGYLDAAAGHGAFATGIVQQVAPEGVVVVHKAIDSDGIGSDVRVAEALLEAVIDEQAEIVSLSLGTQTVDDHPPLGIEVALELLQERGYGDVLLVAAAGNYGTDRRCWPAAFHEVLAVASLRSPLAPGARPRASEWSSRGDWVDVSAVGEGVVSTYVRGLEADEFAGASAPDDWRDDRHPWALWSGTSFAAPQVAAEVARRLSQQRSAGAASTPKGVLEALLLEGQPVDTPGYGAGLHLLSGTPRPDVAG